MGEHEFRIEEGQRQLTLLALAQLALEHPGFDYALSEIAKRLGEENGTTMYAGFKEIRKDLVATREAEHRAVVLALNWLDAFEAPVVFGAGESERAEMLRARERALADHLRQHFRTDSGGASKERPGQGAKPGAAETPAPQASPPLDPSAVSLTAPAEGSPPREEASKGPLQAGPPLPPIDAGGYEDPPIRCGFGLDLKGQPVSIDGAPVSAFGGQVVIAEQKAGVIGVTLPRPAEHVVLGDAALATLELGAELAQRTGLSVDAFDNATAVEAREAKARAGDLASLAWLIAKGLGEQGWKAEEVGPVGFVRVDFGQGRAFCRYVTFEITATALESYQSSSQPSRWLVNVLRGYDDRLRGIAGR